MKNSRILQNITWSVLARFGAQGLSVITHIILARVLGANGFGEYAYISAVILIANALTTFGTDMFLIRKISIENNFSDISASLTLQIILSALFIFVLWAAKIFFQFPNSLLFYSFSLIPLAFFTIASAVLRTIQNANLFSFLQFSVSLLQFLCASYILLWHANVTFFSTLLIIAHCFSAIFGIFLCKLKIPNFSHYLKFSFVSIPALIKASINLALIGFFRLVYERITFTILPIEFNLNAVGLFSASSKIIDVTKLGFISIFTPIYPEMVRNQKFVTHQTGFKLLLFSATFFSLTFFGLAEYLVYFLFGSEYEASIVLLKIMAWVLPFYVIVSYYTLGFVSLKIEKPVLHSLTASLLGLITMLVVLNQLLGLVGSALAVLCAEILQAMLLSWQWRKYGVSKLS